MPSRPLFSFPETVNEVAARTVATGVVTLSVIYLVTGSPWVLAAIAYGFVARVLAGPTLSPLGQFATRVVAPRLSAHERIVAGAPKRFAQGIGVGFSAVSLAAHLSGFTTFATVLMTMLVGAAFLEAAFGFCLGCTIYGRLIAAGILPETACEACSDITKRPSLAGS